MPGKDSRGGITSELEVKQTESELASALTIIPDLRRQLHIRENALSVLLGHNPAPISRGSKLLAQSLPLEVPAGLPVQLLRRRPDIQQSEFNLIAACQRIGIAEADFYPTFSLSAIITQEAPHVSSMFNSTATAWEIGGASMVPIFSGGRLEGNLEVAKARYEQARLQYEKVIQNAFREADNALVSYYEAKEIRNAQESLLQANREYASLAFIMYANGEADYLDYLDAQRKLFSAELSLSQAIRDQFTSLVSLYKALGGGWGSLNKLSNGSSES